MDPEEEATMKDPRRVRVSGPLAAYRDGFAAELAGRGYTPGSAQHQVGLLAHLSRWLDSRGLSLPFNLLVSLGP
jgi:integrase/recombinase XerD